MRNEIWSLVQRLLSFEEPVDKWFHFKNSIAKLDGAKASLSVTAQGEEAWVSALRQAMSESFALSEEEVTRGCEFAAAFADQESRRFTSSGLKMWQHRFAEEIGQLQPIRGGEDYSRLLWKKAFTRLGPVFAAMLRDGPWQEDERGRFVRACLTEMQASGDHPPAIDLAERRCVNEHLPASCLPNLIVLVEGATEAVLLPLLADCVQSDLQQQAALLIPAGGANQVVKKYLYLKEVYSLPIFVILDRDAEEQSDMLASNLRQIDKLHVLSDGEIEDVLRLEVLVPMLNRYIAILPGIVNDNLPVKREHFIVGVPRKQTLARLWRERGLGKFDKVGFAKFVAEDLPGQGAGRKALSDDGLAMIESMRQQSLSWALQYGNAH